VYPNNLKGELNVKDIITGIASSFEHSNLGTELNNCAISPSIAIKDKFKLLVDDLISLSEAGVEDAVKDASSVVNALITVTTDCAQTSLSSPQLTHFHQDLEQINKNLFLLAQHEESFIGNVIMNEEQLKKDNEILKNA